MGKSTTKTGVLVLKFLVISIPIIYSIASLISVRNNPEKNNLAAFIVPCLVIADVILVKYSLDLIVHSYVSYMEKPKAKYVLLLLDLIFLVLFAILYSVAFSAGSIGIFILYYLLISFLSIVWWLVTDRVLSGPHRPTEISYLWRRWLYVNVFLCVVFLASFLLIYFSNDKTIILNYLYAVVLFSVIAFLYDLFAVLHKKLDYWNKKITG